MCIPHTHSGIVLNNKKKFIPDTCNHMDKSQNHYAKWKRAKYKEYILHDSIYIKFYKRQMMSESRSVVASGQKVGEWTDYKEERGNF